MITLSADKHPSDSVFCLFGYLFSAFLIAFLLSFEVLMIMNEIFHLVLSSHFAIILIRIFLPACPIRTYLGST